MPSSVRRVHHFFDAMVEEHCLRDKGTPYCSYRIAGTWYQYNVRNHSGGFEFLLFFITRGGWLPVVGVLSNIPPVILDTDMVYSRFANLPPGGWFL